MRSMRLAHGRFARQVAFQAAEAGDRARMTSPLARFLDAPASSRKPARCDNTVPAAWRSDFDRLLADVARMRRLQCRWAAGEREQLAEELRAATAVVDAWCEEAAT